MVLHRSTLFALWILALATLSFIAPVERLVRTERDPQARLQMVERWESGGRASAWSLPRRYRVDKARFAGDLGMATLALMGIGRWLGRKGEDPGPSHR